MFTLVHIHTGTHTCKHYLLPIISQGVKLSQAQKHLPSEKPLFTSEKQEVIR